MKIGIQIESELLWYGEEGALKWSGSVIRKCEQHSKTH